jgi:hypothetical protein
MSWNITVEEEEQNLTVFHCIPGWKVLWLEVHPGFQLILLIKIILWCTCLILTKSVFCYMRETASGREVTGSTVMMGSAWGDHGSLSSTPWRKEIRRFSPRIRFLPRQQPPAWAPGKIGMISHLHEPWKELFFLKLWQATELTWGKHLGRPKRAVFSHNSRFPSVTNSASEKCHFLPAVSISPLPSSMSITAHLPSNLSA